MSGCEPKPKGHQLNIRIDPEMTRNLYELRDLASTPNEKRPRFARVHMNRRESRFVHKVREDAMSDAASKIAARMHRVVAPTGKEHKRKQAGIKASDIKGREKRAQKGWASAQHPV